MLPIIMIIENEQDRITISEIYTEYKNYMFAVALSHLKDKNLAEDIVSQAVIKIIEKYKIYFSEICPKTKGLIGIIVRGLCIDHLRHKQALTIEALEDYENSLGDDSNIENAVLSDEGYADLIKIMNTLPADYRDILILTYIYEMNDKDVQNILCIKKDNYRKRLYRAKQALKNKLERGGYTL